MWPSHKLPTTLLILLLLLWMALACSYLPRLSKPQDKGGFYLIFAVEADEAKLPQSIEQTMAVIQKRCDQLGIYCKLQSQSGDKANRIELRISSSMETARIKSILLAEGMELRAVVSPSSPAPIQRYSTKAEAVAAAGANAEVLPYLEEMEGTGVNTESFVIVERTPIVTGQDVSRAKAVAQQTGEADDYQIVFSLNPAGAQRFGTWTAENINRYLAIVLNKQVRSAPYIRSQITDSGEITGRFTKQQAEDIALVLMSGNLPATIELLEEGTYKP